MIQYKKSSSTMIFNKNNELALQLRASSDKSFPSHWDFSAGGGIDDGEDDKLAAERELKEELNIQADIKFVTKEHFTYPAWTPNVTREVDVVVYRAFHNGPFNPDPKEVDRIEFFKLDVIKDMIESGQKFHPEFIYCWNKGIISPE